MKITLLGIEWNIEFVDKKDERLGDNTDGRTLFNKLTILVDKDLVKPIKKETLIHELTHAVLCMQGRCYQKKFDLEELCEFVGFCAEPIIGIANSLILGEEDEQRRQASLNEGE